MADNSKERGWVGLKDLTDADKLATKRSDVEALRGNLKRDWALNRSFYAGAQWTFWNPEMARVEDMGTDKGPAWKVRLTSNQIKPGLAHYVAQLTKTRPTIDAEPDSGADKDVKSAQMAESLYEYLWDELQLNSKTQDALAEAGISGGYWKITWDPLAGKALTFVLGPDGKPILDDELADVFLDEFSSMLEKQGADPNLAVQLAKKTIYLGDIKIEVLPSENVLLDPAASRFEDCTWVICKHSLDPDEIQARWNKKVEPNAVRSSDTPLPFANPADKRPNTLREVFVMYIRPCPSLPNGRYVAWIEDPNTILQDMDWPYPFTDLPLVKFPGLYRPNSPYDDPIITDARPVQKDLNKTLSQIVEHKNLTVRPQMLAPVGSLRQKLTSEPGAVFEYNPVGGAVPQWREAPGIPQYVFAHLEGLQMRLDRIFNRMPSTRDQLPPRADSGHLLEAMQEAVADQLSGVILGIEDALARAGHLIVSYAQKYYEEPRLLKIRGTGGSVQVKKFEAADIAGGFSFRPRYGTGLPRTREGKRAAIMELLQGQLIDPRQALKHLDLADLKGVQAKLARDEDQAYREHDKIRRGQPINPKAIQDAQQALQQFMQQAQQVMKQIAAGQPVDFDGDGKPDDPQQVQQQMQQQMQQLQQNLQDAPWQPLDYEDWDTHIETHSDLMKSVEFENYEPQIQMFFLQHYNLTYQRSIEMRRASMAMDPQHQPQVRINTKATMSAPVMAKVLNQKGIDTDPGEVAQLPLDTEVYDSLDKPNAGESGNDPLEQMGQMIEMQQAQDAHLLNQAKIAQMMGQAEVNSAAQEAVQQQTAGNAADSAALDHAAKIQKMGHAEEAHRAKLKAAQEASKQKGKPSERNKKRA